MYRGSSLCVAPQKDLWHVPDGETLKIKFLRVKRNNKWEICSHFFHTVLFSWFFCFLSSFYLSLWRRSGTATGSNVPGDEYRFLRLFSFFIFVRNLIEKNVRPFIQFRRFCYLFDKSPIIIFFNQIATKMWAGGPHRLAGSGIFLNANPRQ